MITGTVANTAAIIAGSLLGLTAGKRIRTEIKESMVKAMALCVVIIGIKMAQESHDLFPVIISLILGTLIGEIIDIEDKMELLGDYLQKKSKSESGTFVMGFVTASLLYCIGAMAVIGSINDGLRNDSSVLFVKSMLDGVMSIFLASTLGVGVLFSFLPVLVYQGGITLLSSQLTFLTANPMYLNGISVTGGVLILAIGINMLGITRIRTGNMLPAILITPVYDWVYLTYFV